MENIGKKLVEKYCKHQGYGNYSVNEEKLIKAINNALEKAWQEGAIEAQNDAAKEIRDNYVERSRM
jgi:soluble cytochrome b562